MCPYAPVVEKKRKFRKCSEYIWAVLINAQPLAPYAYSCVRQIWLMLHEELISKLPKLNEVAPGHLVAEHNPLEVILSKDPLSSKML